MKQNITIKLNAWIICAVLLIANLTTVVLWQPWNGGTVGKRTIKVTGSTIIESEPDQFVFSPYYQKDGTDKTAINNSLSELSATIVAKLKTLGVADSAIKTSANSYNYDMYAGNSTKTTGTLNLTITLKDKELTQKVQDYLITTSPSGSITPVSTFSTAKQKTLESQARNEAIKDAKEKATASAEQIGTKLGKAITISDATSGGVSPMPWLYGTEDSVKSESSTSSYSVQPGLNEYSFSVEITYEIN